MLDVMPRELASGLWCWTAPHPDWRPDRGGVGGWDRNVGSWLLEEDDRVVLIDPLLPNDHSLLRRLDERIGGRTVDVLITCTGHDNTICEQQASHVRKSAAESVTTTRGNHASGMSNQAASDRPKSA